jgi:hypothetical protein
VGAERSRALTLDAGALIELDRGGRRVRHLLRLALEAGLDVSIAAPAVAQVWRDPRRQALLSRVVQEVRVVPLTVEEAKQVGLLLAARGTADIADGAVALCALRQGREAVILTSDPDDLRQLVPTARIEVV